MEISILEQFVFNCSHKVELGAEFGDRHVEASCAIGRQQCRAVKIVCRTRRCAGGCLWDRVGCYSSSSSRCAAMHHIQKFLPEANIDDRRCCGILSGLRVKAALEDRVDFSRWVEEFVVRGLLDCRAFLAFELRDH